MVNFLTTNETNSVYNACEMRLGKTIQTICAINKLIKLQKVSQYGCSILVICPAVVRPTWKLEFKKWSTIQSIETAEDTKEFLELLIPPFIPNVIITSYDIASKNADKVPDLDRWDFLILDEAHYLASHKSKRTKAILSTLWDRAKYKIALSGTPFLSDVVDGFTLFNKMMPKEFPNFWKFAYRYSHVRKTPFGAQYYGIKNAEELRSIIRGNFFVRFTQNEVRDELPERTYTTVYLDKSLSLEVDKTTEEGLQTIASRIEQGLPVTVPPYLATFRHNQGLLKVKNIIEYSKLFVDANIPIVVFIIHKEVGKKVFEGLKKYNPVLINGETPAKEREESIEKFKNGDTDIFIANCGAGGIGIDLSRANEVILGEIDWSPSVINQAIERVVKLGKKSAIRVSYLVVEDSLDEKIMEVVKRKSETFQKVLVA